MNGRIILFYGKRLDGPRISGGQGEGGKPSKATGPRTNGPGKHQALVDALKGLGLTVVSADQVLAALRFCYPTGADGVPEGEQIRAVFQYLKRGSNHAQ